MSPFQVIVLATPVFLLLIGLELAWGLARERRGTGRNSYRLNDALNSISLGVLSQLSGVFSKLLTIGIYSAVYASVALFPDQAFWHSAPGVLLALLFYDFCYYWLHRSGHRVAVLWAAHSVHHQSQQYNLSTALRQTSSGALLGWLFYLPMAVAGVPPLIFGIVALIDLLYQFWVHTEQIGKLGWFDRVFCSPSNHRVHHGVNEPYLDKNYGGMLVLWDRLFGTFRAEDEACVYGTRAPLNSWDPLWANAQVYWTLLVDSWRARHWPDKLRVWLMPPGWRPADVAARWPKPAFDLARVQTFDPPLARGVAGFAVLQFSALLLGVAAVLWHAELWPTTQVALCSAVLLVSYWALGAVLQGRLRWAEVLLVQAAAVATAAAALGWTDLALLSKPMPMAIAIFLVATKLYASRAGATFYAWLLVALLASLAGDVLLMLPGDHFIAGLAAFLLAHGAYLALFRQGLGWFPSRTALAATLSAGTLVLALLWPGLHGALLTAAVTLYVLLIALMAAQALGRAAVLGDAASRAVAGGAALFMLSDAILGIDRFVQPVPLAPLWVLGCYFVAQILIVLNTRPTRSPAR